MSRGLCWMLALCGVGCVGQEAPEVGSLSLALRHDAASGEVYRLSGATLQITGAEQHTLMPEADEARMELALVPGDYALMLQPGYALQRQDGASWVDVTATLLGDNPQPFAITAGEVTQVALRFALDGAPDVELAGSLEVLLEVEEAGAAGQGGGDECAPRLVINELDYDQEGTDTSDFAELYNAGDCALDTAGVVLSLINGGVAEAPSYEEVDLALAGASLGAGQHVVVGRPTLVVPAGATLIAIEGFSIQNGSPDGLRLTRDGELLDSLSYGGVITGVTESTSTHADSGAGSLGRCPDGTDTDDGAADFGFHTTPTPGASNACP